MVTPKFSEIEAHFHKQPAYRWRQVKHWLFSELIDDWGKASNLSTDSRKKLPTLFPLNIDGEVTLAADKQSVKALLALNDKLKIETVLMRHIDGRNTVCVSSQVGCPLGCIFCATGKMGLARSLDRDEIISQVLFFARYLKNLDGSRVTNVVMMGMGEPFLNYENVIKAIRFLNDREGFGLGGRHFSISTSGLPEGIGKLANEKIEINLAVSLHAPNNELRSKIMPINRRYHLEEVLTAVDEYIKKTKRRVMFEYLLIDGLNDSDKEAESLSKLMKGPLRFVNLIVYNRTGGLRPSPQDRVMKFKSVLRRNGIMVTQRYRFGREIKAACGQLTGVFN